MTDPVRRYYETHPLMVSSPFGGVDGFNRELFEQVCRALNISLDGHSVLDAGCGRGYLSDLAHSVGGTYTGVDLVPSRRRFPFAVADIGHLPFGDASFDVVCCIDAFEHAPEGELAAAEFRRVLRPGGFVFLSAPNYGNVAGVVKWTCERLGSYRRNTWAPFRRWQPQELEQPLTLGSVRSLFGKAGFARARCIGYGGEVGLGLFPWLAHPRMPESLMFRMQRFFARIGPVLVRVWPGASLHGFWKIEV